MFILALEGGEGTGKTSIAQRLVAELKSQYFFPKDWEVVYLKEPGQSDIGNIIRSILLDSKNTNIAPITELLLYMASRAQCIHEYIQDARNKRILFVMDRYVMSSIVYQGYCRGYSDAVNRLHDMILQGLWPDLNIVYTVDPKTGIERSLKRLSTTNGPDESRFEREALHFHETVRDAYIYECEYGGQHMFTQRIDTTDISLDEAYDATLDIVKKVVVPSLQVY